MAANQHGAREYIRDASTSMNRLLHDGAVTLRKAVRDVWTVGVKGAWRLAREDSKRQKRG